MTSTSSFWNGAEGAGIAGARHASFLILYLLLAAGVFGGTLLHHIMWVTRCQDAIDMSHTASALARAYAGMDVTKTVEFKASLNSTVSRILDDKLPTFISRTCISLDVFNASPVLDLAYMAFAACHGLSIAVYYTTAPSLNNRDPGTRTLDTNNRATGRDCSWMQGGNNGLDHHVLFVLLDVRL
ncbi:MAG: hypothetical protein Q9225_001098 [Loekoesia sp. 1 TL-2023]